MEKWKNEKKIEIICDWFLYKISGYGFFIISLYNYERGRFPVKKKQKGHSMVLTGHVW